MTTDAEKAVEALRKIPDAEFESLFNSPWYKFPSELVRDELVRRLKLRTDLSVEAKKVHYKAIIDRYRMIGNVASLDRFFAELAEVDEGSREAFQRAIDASRARMEEMNEHYRQLGELHSQRDDPFEGKAKPGDWRPDGAELCPVCGGGGKGADAVEASFAARAEHREIELSTVYYLPGNGGRLETGLGEGLMERGWSIAGRETIGEFRSLRFLDQVAIVAEDLRAHF
eukprot:gene24803-45687_t